MKKIFKVLIYSITLITLVTVASLVVVYLQVSNEATALIERGAIDNILFSESPVYYDDQVTPIGVYFEKIHSKYILYKDIPKTYIKALIASEDGDFFNHPGFDMSAILRAFIANCKAGKIVQGGSTITQQTVKNIFIRGKKSYISKLKELMQALLLEKIYSKEEIIEMYVNQFFVTGLGKGLMISAEYFFDKDARDLDLVESAFIAGMVKGPNKYNPFTKKTDDEKKEALRIAKMRKDYVLKNMRKQNFITEDQYIEARDREVPFKEGKVTYQLNVILDYIREQLESDYFKEILHKQGVDNIATSGIKIYTSISKEIQEGALDSIRKQLPLLDIQLTGYNNEQFQERYTQYMGTLYENKDVAGIPFFCKIKAINNDKDNPSLSMAWDGGEGTIGYEGIKTMGEAWLKWKLGSWAIFDRSNVSDFIKNFHEGELVPVYFVENKEKDGEESLMLWEIPDLEGGIIVLKNGMIKAMVGGFFDRYFNRAADAKRQLGSIFKPLVYTAALQLRWNNLDQLNNVPDLFKFENTFYIPKPDHEPKSNKVSMTWAGTKSENLATVWLLYHLTDRLNMSEFREVIERLGLAREKTETYNEYARRIRDTYGVVVNQEVLMEAAFEEAKREIESDLIFSGNEAALDNISRLHFDIDENGLDLKGDSDFQISRLGFKRIRSLNYNMKKRFKDLLQLIEIYKKKGTTDQDLKASLRYFYYNKIHDTNRIIYSEEADRTHYDVLEGITLEQLSNRTPFISPEEVWIDDIIPSEAIDLIQTNMSRRYRELLALNRYDLDTLCSVRDFRTLVNLFYVKQLAKEMGISTMLDPVLSFPLGANSISILEAALSYNTIVSGSFYPLSKKSMSDMAPVITKIVDRNDEMIWEYVPLPEKVLTERVSGSITEILRMVIENGTGKNADDSVRLSMNFDEATLDIPIPAFGKTGTANLFTNSSFVGVIPGLERNTGEFDIDECYVVASYVGYDDNRPMKGRHINIYGSSGALPVWIDTCNVIVNSSGYREGLQVADLAFLTQSGPLLADKTLSPAKVSSITGLPFATREEKPSSEVIEVYSDITMDGDVLTLKRAFEPLTGVYNENNK